MFAILFINNFIENKMQTDKNKKILILSIDGGGVKGAGVAFYLKEIEKHFNKPIAELFDLLVGNSTGALLATAMSTGNIPASEVLKIYSEKGKDIFKKKPLFKRIFSLGGLIDEKYELLNLVNVVKQFLKETTFKDTKTKLMTISYDLYTKKPFIHKSWKSKINFPLWVAAVSSAAAPTYFEPLLYKDETGLDYGFIDGGATAINNPTMCALAEALNMGYTLENIYVLSFGTGYYQKDIDPVKTLNWGLLEWLKTILDILLDGSNIAVDYQVSSILKSSNYLRINFPLSANLAPMDNYKNIPELIKLAESNFINVQDKIYKFIENFKK